MIHKHILQTTGFDHASLVVHERVSIYTSLNIQREAAETTQLGFRSSHSAENAQNIYLDMKKKAFPHRDGTSRIDLSFNLVHAVERQKVVSTMLCNSCIGEEINLSPKIYIVESRARRKYMDGKVRDIARSRRVIHIGVVEHHLPRYTSPQTKQMCYKYDRCCSLRTTCLHVCRIPHHYRPSMPNMACMCRME